MKKNNKNRMPLEILVYICDRDTDSSEPIYSVAFNVNEIPEDCNGELVGIYALNSCNRLSVKRELESLDTFGL